jgi:hypothetical protein
MSFEPKEKDDYTNCRFCQLTVSEERSSRSSTWKSAPASVVMILIM